MASFHALWCKGILIDCIHTRAAELSGAVDRGAHAVDRRIGKTLSAYFLTEQAAFFILIALVKNVTVHPRFAAEWRIL